MARRVKSETMQAGLPAQSAKDELAEGGVLRPVAVYGILAGILMQAFPLSPQVVAATVGGSAGLLLLVDKEVRPAVRGASTALYLFGAGFLAASVASVLGSEAAARGLRVSISLLPQLLVFQAVATRFCREDIDRLVVALIVLSTTIACVLLLTALAHPRQDPSKWMEIAALPFFSVPNDLLITVVLAPFPFVTLLSARGAVAKVLAGISLLACLAAMIVYQSRTGVALFAVMCFGVVVAEAKIRWQSALWLSTGVVGLFVLIDAVTGFALLHKFAQLNSLSTRIPLWIAACKMFLTAPWFGHGPGTFSLLYEGYQSSIHFPGWVRVIPQLHAPWAHSLYLEVLAERGLFALLCLLGVIYAAGRMLKAAWARSKDSLWIGLTASLTLIVLGGLSEFSVLRYWFSQLLLVVLGMVVALNQSGEKRDA
jgi:O-antigen ligase